MQELQADHGTSILVTDKYGLEKHYFLPKWLRNGGFFLTRSCPFLGSWLGKKI